MTEYEDISNSTENDKDFIELKVDEIEADEKVVAEEKKKKQKSFFTDCLETLLYIGIAFLVAYFVTNYVAQRTVVDGSSMERTLTHGDNLIMDKLSYKLGDVKRFDVVVFPYKNATLGEVNYIKRIIGMPGEVVTITDGKIYITDENGQYVLEENYGYYEGGVPMEGYNAAEPMILGDDEYFVLGDNRNGSSDSRMIGPIKRDVILGKAFFRVYPFDEIGFIK